MKLKKNNLNFTLQNISLQNSKKKIFTKNLLIKCSLSFHY
jgi:hypothetical protein